MKYFDASLDMKSKREQEAALRQQRPQAKQPGSVMGQAVVEEDTVGKTTIGFLRPNGLVGSKFEVYNSIDAVRQDVQKPNYASKQYTKEIQKTLLGSSSKKELKPAFSPEQAASKMIQKPIGPKQKKQIQISKASEARDEDTRQEAVEAMVESQSLLKAGTEVDMRLHQLVG